MRKTGIFALCLVLAVAVVGCSATKIAVVSPSRLFQESDSGKAGIEHLKNLEAAMQAQVQVAQDMLEKSPTDDALRTRFQLTFAGYQQLANDEQQKVISKINEVMRSSLDTYRNQKGYTAIISSEGLMSFDPKADVTSDIIAEMNRTPVSFEPVQLEDLTEEVAKDKAAGAAETR